MFDVTGNNLQIFPLFFRAHNFDETPAGLRYMLATTNIISFPDVASDEHNMRKMLHALRTRYAGLQVTTAPMRHGEDVEAPKDRDAKIPATVPQLPDVISERPSVISELRGHLLGFLAAGESLSISSVKSARVSAHGAGGAGKTMMVISHIPRPRPPIPHNYHMASFCISFPIVFSAGRNDRP